MERKERWALAQKASSGPGFICHVSKEFTRLAFFFRDQNLTVSWSPSKRSAFSRFEPRRDLSPPGTLCPGVRIYSQHRSYTSSDGLFPRSCRSARIWKNLKTFTQHREAHLSEVTFDESCHAADEYNGNAPRPSVPLRQDTPASSTSRTDFRPSRPLLSQTQVLEDLVMYSLRRVLLPGSIRIRL